MKYNYATEASFIGLYAKATFKPIEAIVAEAGKDVYGMSIGAVNDATVVAEIDAKIAQMTGSLVGMSLKIREMPVGTKFKAHNENLILSATELKDLGAGLVGQVTSANNHSYIVVADPVIEIGDEVDLIPTGDQEGAFSDNICESWKKAVASESSGSKVTGLDGDQVFCVGGFRWPKTHTVIVKKGQN